MMVALTADHRYLVDGQPVPGFTEICRAIGLVDYYNKDPYYLDRGRVVHIATALIDKGRLDWDTVDERIEGFLQAYLRFRCEQPFNNCWEHSETSLHHPLYRYCGTPDRFLPLIDIKTGQGDPIQLDAYAELLRANGYDPGRAGYMLHLRADGSYRLKAHKFDRQLLGVWLSAVSVYHYKKGKGLL